MIKQPTIKKVLNPEGRLNAAIEILLFLKIKSLYFVWIELYPVVHGRHAEEAFGSLITGNLAFRKTIHLRGYSKR